MHLMWIGGKDVPGATGKTFDIINPATEAAIGSVPRANAQDARLAIAAANAACKDWAAMPGAEKAELLHRVAEKMRHMRERLADLMTAEGGKPRWENLDEIAWTVACFDYYAEIGRNSRGNSIPPVMRHQVNFTIKEPYGVAVAIVPWNYPLLLMSWKVAPALAAGNTVIIKPSEQTPLATLALKEAFAELPPGVVNIITDWRGEAAEELVSSKDTHVIAFTGSYATGQRIMELARPRVKKLVLELSGIDPCIVCDDYPLDLAVPAVAFARFLNTGQVCTSAKRIYVMDSIADEFTRRMVEYVKALKIGDGMRHDTDIGPLISKAACDKVHGQVRQALAEGATLLYGGKPHGTKGWFYEPTVLGNCRQDMTMFREECFGPVMPIVRVKTFEEAVALANDSDFGLGANILTTSLARAMYAMEHIKAGTFWINDPLTDNDAGPFGGMRLSGKGRELGEEGLDEFRETKHVHLDWLPEEKPWWYPYGTRRKQ
jgi:betaine-aldehyde dehydrogenase